MLEDIKKIGVIGAGQMGSGIAHVCVLGGYDVHVVDIDEDRLEAARTAIGKNMDRQIAKGSICEDDKKAALKRLTGGSQLADFADCDLVIEAATEDEEIKKGIIADLCPHLKASAIIATNTSSISITRMAARTDRAEKFIGMHFMNPVPVMELVELIRGIATSSATYDVIHALTLKLGKVPTSSEDFPAFIVNRILMPMINEAIYVLYEGVGSVECIDKSLTLGARHPLGPLALADFIGLDTCLAIMSTLHEGLADTKYRPCPLLVKYVEAGWLGRKTGRGFYDYAGDKPVPTR